MMEHFAGYPAIEHSRVRKRLYKLGKMMNLTSRYADIET